jgi:hypothetical protein
MLGNFNNGFVKFKVEIRDYVYGNNEKQPHCKGCFYLIDNDEVVKNTFINAKFKFKMLKNKVLKVIMPSREHETASQKHFEERYKTISTRLYGDFCVIVSTMKKIDYECIGYQKLNQNDVQGKIVFSAFVIFVKPLTDQEPEANQQSPENLTGLEDKMENLMRDKKK